MTREEAIKRMEICRNFLANNYSDMGEPNFTAFNMAIEALEQLTSYEQTINKLTKAISEQEPKTGHWIAQDIHNCHTDFKCSECGYIHSFMHLYGKPTADYTYCPNCGARMESGAE